MSVRTTVVKGGLWTSLSTGVNVLVQILRIAILTRFLDKSDFGVVAIVGMVLALCISLSDLGFSSVIMYKDSLSRKEFSSLYWIQAIVYICLFVAISFLSGPISHYYDLPVLKELIPIAALSLLALAMGKLYENILRKNFQFKSLSVRNIIVNVLSLILAVILAWAGYGVYSLIYSTLFQTVSFSLWNLISGYRIKPIVFYLSFKEVKGLVSIGMFQMYSGILDFLSNKVDILVMGKLLGTEALGVYDLAKNLAFRVSDYVRSVVAQVALPYITKDNTSNQVIVSRFLSVSKVLAFVLVPIIALLCIFSKEITLLMYGYNYLEIAPLISILALATLVNSMASLYDILGISKGRTDLNFKNTVARVIVTLPIIAISCSISLLAATIGQVVASLSAAILFWIIVVKKLFAIQPKLYFQQFQRVALVSMIGIVSAIAVSILLPLDTFWLTFALKLIVVLFVFAIGAKTILNKEITSFIALFQEIRKR